MAGDDGITLISDARKAAGDPQAPSFESSEWARLAHASDAHSFAASWLDIQCRAFDGVIRAIVVLRPHGSAQFTPVPALAPVVHPKQPLFARVTSAALAPSAGARRSVSVVE